MKDNVIPFEKRLIQVSHSKYIEDELEVVLIVDCEDTRQLIKTALGYEAKKEVHYG